MEILKESSQQHNWFWVIALSSSTVTQNIHGSWWRIAIRRPKWTLLASLHKALAWIRMKIYGVYRRPEGGGGGGDWPKKNGLGLLRRRVWKPQQISARCYPEKRIHNRLLASGGLIIFTWLFLFLVKLFCFCVQSKIWYAIPIGNYFFRGADNSVLICM